MVETIGSMATELSNSWCSAYEVGNRATELDHTTTGSCLQCVTIIEVCDTILLFVYHKTSDKSPVLVTNRVYAFVPVIDWLSNAHRHVYLLLTYLFSKSQSSVKYVSILKHMTNSHTYKCNNISYYFTNSQ